MQAVWPSHEGALNGQCKRLRKTGHQFDGFAARQIGHQRSDDRLARRLECRHVFRGEVALDDVPVTRVRRRIHRIGDGEMISGRVSESLVVPQHVHHVRMTKH